MFSPCSAERRASDKDFPVLYKLFSTIHFFKIIIFFLAMVILISVTMTRSLISFSRSRMNRKTEIILLTLNVSIFCQIIDVLWWPLWFDKKSISGSLLTMARISLIKVKLVKCRRGGWFVSDFVLQITDELQNRETLNVSIFLLIRSLKSKIWLKSISWLLTNFRWASFCSWNSSNDDNFVLRIMD